MNGREEARRGTKPRHFLLRAILCLLVAIPVLSSCDSRFGFADIWLTRDQQGHRLLERAEYSEAATRFTDPMWKGTSLYLAERFDQALDQFARVDTPEAWFARGNALAHLERYEEAVAAYEHALELRPDYPAVEANVDYLQPFLPLKFEGGVMGTEGRDAAADDVVYDADADRLDQEGRDTEIDGGGLLSEDQLADMWLQQVDASPAAFLRAKFRFQLARQDDDE